jgi:hypothetical protein
VSGREREREKTKLLYSVKRMLVLKFIVPTDQNTVREREGRER